MGGKDKPHDNLYLLLSGSAAYEDSTSHTKQILSAGSLIGFCPGYTGSQPPKRYSAFSNLSMLKIPKTSYDTFVCRNNLEGYVEKMNEVIMFFTETVLFKKPVSILMLARAAQQAEPFKYPAGHQINGWPSDQVGLIQQGSIVIKAPDRTLKSLQAGDSFGGESSPLKAPDRWRLEVEEDSAGYMLPFDVIVEISMAYSRLLTIFAEMKSSFIKSSFFI